MGKKKKKESKKDDTSISSSEIYHDFYQDDVTHCDTCHQSLFVQQDGSQDIKTISVSEDKLLECHFTCGFTDQPKNPQAADDMESKASRVTFADDDQFHENEPYDKTKTKKKNDKKDKDKKKKKGKKNKYEEPELSTIEEDITVEEIQQQWKEGEEEEKEGDGCLGMLHDTTGIKVEINMDDYHKRVDERKKKIEEMKVEVLGNDIDENNSKKFDFQVKFVLRKKTYDEVEEEKLRAAEEAMAKAKEKMRMDEVRNMQKEDMKERITFLIGKCSTKKEETDSEDEQDGKTTDKDATGCLQTIYIYFNLTFSKYCPTSRPEPQTDSSDGSQTSSDQQLGHGTEHAEGYAASVKGSRVASQKFSGDTSTKSSGSSTTTKSDKSSDIFDMFRSKDQEKDTISVRDVNDSEGDDDGDKEEEQGYIDAFFERSKSLVTKSSTDVSTKDQSIEREDRRSIEGEGSEDRRSTTSKSTTSKSSSRTGPNKVMGDIADKVEIVAGTIIEKVEDVAEDVYDKVEDIADNVAEKSKFKKNSRSGRSSENSQPDELNSSASHSSGDSGRESVGFLKDVINKSKHIYTFESKELIQRGGSEPDLTMEDPGEDEVGCLFDTYETLPEGAGDPANHQPDENYTVPESRYDKLFKEQTSSPSSSSPSSSSVSLSKKPVKPTDSKLYKEDEKPQWKFWSKKKKKVEKQPLPVPPPNNMWTE